MFGGSGLNLAVYWNHFILADGLTIGLTDNKTIGDDWTGISNKKADPQSCSKLHSEEVYHNI